MHGVEASGGSRYSLVLFFGQVCPFAEHERVLCDPDCMVALYAADGGEYHCDHCKRSCFELGFSSMYKCASGCEYDLCRECHAECAPYSARGESADADTSRQYVGRECSFLPNYLFE